MRKLQFQQIYTKSIIPLFVGSSVMTVFAGDVNSVTAGKNINGGYEIQIGGKDLKNIRTYSLDNPARIIVDIPNASSNLSQRITEVAHPIVSNVAVIEGDDRVRATINLSKALPYKIIEKNNKITVAFANNRIKSTVNSQLSKNNKFAIIDFTRGKDEQGKVQIKLPDPKSTIDVIKQGKKVIAKLQGGQFINTRKLNVSDFGTSVKSIDVYKNSVSISTFDNNFEIVSYQNDDIFSIEFNKSKQQEINQKQLLPGDNRKKYLGDPLSLNFQDIEVRSVLQLIGDFTNTNIVVSGAVEGSITLRLNNVPWDQALDIILQTKGLSKQENGDVIYIAPSKDIADSKRAAYDVANVEKELAPLQQQLIQVQYARAEEIEKIIEDNSDDKGNKDDISSVDGLLSARGRVSTDRRTNTLIINDVPSSIEKVRRLVSKLDVSVDQVLIDARIVTAYNSFAHELGVRWGGAFTGATDDIAFGGSGKLEGANNITSSANRNISKTGQAFPTATPGLGDRLGVNLAAANPAGSFGLSILGSDFLIDMELSAMENEGRGEVISSPRVIAQDGGEAEIRQGTQIPYLKLDEEGNTVTEFKDIPLKLVVKPKIAPNDQVDMELEIIKDRVGENTRDGIAINSSSVKTQVLVDNGETVVLGGVYEQTTRKDVNKVPVLGDLPIVGRAFRSDSNSVRKNELLIFVTPKIIDKRYTSKDKFIDIRN